MQKKALTLAGCIALATPTISVAQALPDYLVGLDLGEIDAKSYLNQPFVGSIPFLFSQANDARDLTVQLAPASVFQQIGAERLPILEQLRFEVSITSGKPVIQIRSDAPIHLPFLNLVLEINGPKGVSYQDFTVLLDPPSYSGDQVEKLPPAHRQANNIANTALFFDTYASSSVTTQATKTYTVKAGDSLSKIAKKLKSKDDSLADMVQALYEKNPKAFIKADINRIKRGAVLQLPSLDEISNSVKIVEKPTVEIEKNTDKVSDNVANKYTVKKGDSLFKVTKQFVEEGESFTKTMNAIFQENPEAFSKGKKNLLKAGAILDIPSLKQPESKIAETQAESKEVKKAVTVGEKIATTNDIASTKQEYKESSQNQSKSSYVVKKGDTLSTIVNQVNAQQGSVTKSMKSLFVANPNAFESNNITKLKEGAVLDLSILNSDKNQNTVKTDQPVFLKNSAEKQQTVSVKNTSKLEKRIRELRTELNKTKLSLNDLEVKLEEKDELIDEKNYLLEELKSNFVNLNQDGIDKVELNDFLNDADKREEILKNSELAIAASSTDYKNGFNAKFYAFINNTFSESNAKNLSYGALALLLGLFLIRYRREIYSYTTISYDYPKYYPAPDAKESKEKYPLKEKNINYSDYLVDPLDERFSDNLLGSENNNQQGVDESESEEVQHAEHLVTELFEDLDKPEDDKNINTEWQSIENVCDEYIETVKEKNDLENSLKATTKEMVTDPDNKKEIEVADFDEMMNDLLASLNDVEETITKNGMNQIDTKQSETQQDLEIQENVEEALEIFEQYQVKSN